MTSNNNVYQYCYNINNGAVIYIQDTTLNEQYSTFQQNSAITGGVIRCVGSTTSINSSVSVFNSYFYSNQAQSGGAFDIENSCTLTID